MESVIAMPCPSSQHISTSETVLKEAYHKNKQILSNSQRPVASFNDEVIFEMRPALENKVLILGPALENKVLILGSALESKVLILGPALE